MTSAIRFDMGHIREETWMDQATAVAIIRVLFDHITSGRPVAWNDCDALSDQLDPAHNAALRRLVGLPPTLTGPASWEPGDIIEARREAERATLLERGYSIEGWRTTYGFLTDWQLTFRWRRIEPAA